MSRHKNRRSAPVFFCPTHRKVAEIYGNVVPMTLNFASTSRNRQR